MILHPQIGPPKPPTLNTDLLKSLIDANNHLSHINMEYVDRLKDMMRAPDLRSEMDELREWQAREVAQYETKLRTCEETIHKMEETSLATQRQLKKDNEMQAARFKEDMKAMDNQIAEMEKQHQKTVHEAELFIADLQKKIKTMAPIVTGPTIPPYKRIRPAFTGTMPRMEYFIKHFIAPGSGEFGTEVYRHYLKFCQRTGYGHDNREQLFKHLREAGYDNHSGLVKKGGRTSTGFVNLKLVSTGFDNLTQV